MLIGGAAIVAEAKDTHVVTHFRTMDWAEPARLGILGELVQPPRLARH